MCQPDRIGGTAVMAQLAAAAGGEEEEEKESRSLLLLVIIMIIYKILTNTALNKHQTTSFYI